MRRRTLVASLLAAPAAIALAPTTASANSGESILPDVINLPNGWNPEGIAILGTDFYVGSLATGGIFKGSVLNGQGKVLVPQGPGSQAVGLEFDFRGRLWACGAGGATVYHSRTGAQIARYEFGGSFVNDAIATHDGVYFTDSVAPALYFVPFGPGGSLKPFKTIPLTGQLGEADAFNNGIEVLPNGKLLVVQMIADRLISFDPRSGAQAAIDLGGASVFRGDGMVRHGRTLYIVRNQLNRIAKFEFSAGFASAKLDREITDSRFQIPATMDLFGPFAYAVNARFDTTPTPDTTYNIIRVSA